MELTEGDREVVEAARETIRVRYRSGRHHVASAVLAGSGQLYTGVHLETTVGRAAICAEPVALGRALTEGEDRIETVAAVLGHEPGVEPSVIPPCGICRELLADYAPDARVIVPREGGPVAAEAIDLLPDNIGPPLSDQLEGG